MLFRSGRIILLSFILQCVLVLIIYQRYNSLNSTLVQNDYLLFNKVMENLFPGLNSIVIRLSFSCHSIVKQSMTAKPNDPPAPRLRRAKQRSK